MNDTPELFAEMPSSKPRSMLEWVAQPGVTLTPTQRAFKQLIGNIESAETRIKELAELLDVFRVRFQEKFQPLAAQQQHIDRDMVRFLDVQLRRKNWTANQRGTMESIICQIIGPLLEGEFGAEMVEIFNRHSDVSAEELAEMDGDMFGSENDGEHGNEPPPDGQDPIEELMREMRAQHEAAVAKKEARANAKRGGKKSARQIKLEQQTLDADKLLKEIYRKLTSLLHPDREPDEAERVRKTALMTKANKAYKNKDLLTLLHLQIQAGKVDSLAAGNLADEKLQHINFTLRQQQEALRTEQIQLEHLVRQTFQLSYADRITVPVIEKRLKAGVAERKKVIKWMHEAFAEIQRGDAPFKAWLKGERASMQAGHDLDAVIDDMLSGGRRSR